MTGLATYSRVSLIGLTFFMAACGGQTSNSQALSTMRPPAILPDAGQAHFRSRVAEISAESPIPNGTVLIGDSITEAWMWQRELETYPFERPVRNHGVGWDVTEGAVSRLPLLEPSAPDRIFIKIGTNDISFSVPLADMQKDFETLLSRLRQQEPQAQIFVQSVLPRESDKLEKIARVNAMQAKLTQEFDAVYIDLTSVFAQPDGTLASSLTDDGLHLNAVGYALWGEALLPYIQ